MDSHSCQCTRMLCFFYIFMYVCMYVLCLLCNDWGEPAVGLQTNRLKFKTVGKLQLVLEEIIEYAPI